MRKTGLGIQSRQLTIFAVVVGAAVAYILYLMTLSGAVHAPGVFSYKVNAVLPSAGAQLVPGARVTMSGVQVGRVAGVERRGNGAVIKMELTEKGVTPLPVDSRAQLRSRSPLGENYIAIDPGRESTTLPEDATLPIDQAKQTVDVDEVLSVLQGTARTNARRLIRGVGGAVRGNSEQLNVLLGSTASTMTHGSHVVDAIYGQREQLARLVDQLGTVADGVAARGDDIRDLARGGVATFRALATQDSQVTRLADVLPSTLDQVKGTTNRLSRTTDVAAPVLGELASTIRDAKPAARALAPAAAELNEVVDNLGAASPPLQRTLIALRKASGPTATALPELHKTLCQVDPMLTYLKPYVSDVVQVMTSLGSASNAYDAIGHTIRLAPTINDDSYTGLDQSQKAAVDTLLHAGALTKYNGLTYDPYPKPHSANATATDLPHVTGPETVKAQSGFTYPHITADC